MLIPAKRKLPPLSIGQKIGRLELVSSFIKNNNRWWTCKCDCGNTTDVDQYKLKIKHTQSCGCLQKNRASEANLTHGESTTRLYHIWADMIIRCNNPRNKAYDWYGGRGIKVCEEWLDFLNFKEWSFHSGYNEDLTIDRKNVNGNYDPDNCKWATWTEQANNTRRNVLITAFGETKNLLAWSKDPRCKISPSWLCRRIKQGIESEVAISQRKLGK